MPLSLPNGGAKQSLRIGNRLLYPCLARNDGETTLLPLPANLLYVRVLGGDFSF